MDRTERIAGEMRRALSDILRNDLKDPRIPTVTSVTNIKLAKDLKYAKVYISIYAGEEEKKSGARSAARLGRLYQEGSWTENDYTDAPGADVCIG